MTITIGTFNLNNLFSRFNFSSAIDEIQASGGSAGAVTVRYEFTDSNEFKIRTFLGKLVKGKNVNDTSTIAKRIKDIDIDVLAVQEVEDVNILKKFNSDSLGGLYPHVVLIEGNDPRFIDVGIMSKYPIGSVTSFQTAVHPNATSRRVFSRDLLEVEILTITRSRRLFTLYNTHLKSHFGDDDNGGQGKAANDARRLKQAEMINKIIASRMRTTSRYIVTGDMNDDVDAAPLAPITEIDGNQMINALQNPSETRQAKQESTGPGPTTPAWTHRFKRSGQAPEFHLFDQIWLSQPLLTSFVGGHIDRRKKHGGDGSDHDPAWVEVDL